MPLNLTKGQKIDLTKINPTLKNIMIGLGWDVSGGNFDLDAAAFYWINRARRVPRATLFFTTISSTSRARLSIWAIP